MILIEIKKVISTTNSSVTLKVQNQYSDENLKIKSTITYDKFNGVKYKVTSIENDVITLERKDKKELDNNDILYLTKIGIKLFNI